MSEVTRFLSAIEQGDAHAAEQLPPLVYDEPRKLAAPGRGMHFTGIPLDSDPHHRYALTG